MTHRASKKNKFPSSIVSLITLLLLSTACNQADTKRSVNAEQSPQAQEAASTPTAESKKIKVVASFLPMYWFTQAVAGDAADVAILVPPGTEVHEYQATPENVKAIATANLLVKNGLGLEEFLEPTVKNAQNAKLTQIDASKGIQTVEEISPVVEAANKAEHNHEHGEGNPHVWLDPVLAKQQVINIRDGLIAADPANKATYEANAAAYIKQLEDLHNQYQQTLQKNPNCTFITFHDAYPYLAKRYNLKQVAVVEIPEDQLTPTDVQKAVNAVKKYNVKALFGEPGIDNKLLKSLSQDLNLTLYELDSLETGSTDPQHYFQAMRNNLQTLETACQ
ncbi:MULTISPECIES: metal ABC transporter solute-binding protein, Zn/Mn family [Fischerella]|uniref:ABC transporter substrate-binding protein n=1 Tax=Fischerella muscicola CCMEE 5323 TaxID=2019572 RepID=A0A2N6K6P8_FISMU|nr:zinc ABC transporter substrate-binding protein [Fischerella muscicola]MBD2433927.1 zinc ABC transporter substrate-binding protein [Fischerella sp. FACHB-380]PLZ92667.1 ABC transporter substrate-binding protein [Fischerella muscicola CCMEE 5323]